MVPSVICRGAACCALVAGQGKPCPYACVGGSASHIGFFAEGAGTAFLQKRGSRILSVLYRPAWQVAVPRFLLRPRRRIVSLVVFQSGDYPDQ